MPENPPDLRRLLRPRTVALFGGNASAEVIRQCRRMGYDGAIWPVHPRLDTVGGLPAYRSAAALPAAPDAALIAVNRAASVGIMAELAARGAGGAVAYASGFAEVGGEGAALQQQLVAAAGEMPFFGPNCHGFVNYLDGAALWPEQHGGKRLERGVAIVTQSGNIALNLTMQTRGVPIAYLVTLGNQAAIGLSATVATLVEDPRVTAIGLHIEGIDDPAAFLAAAGRARSRRVPLVAVKTGRSAAGARLALSHTASLSGPDAVASAFLKRAGVARVRSLPALLETLKLLHVHGTLPGSDIASMSCSGGEAGLIADCAEDWGLRFRPLTGAQAARVAAALPEFATASNPLDYHNFTWGDEAALTATFGAMMAAGFDLTLLVIDFPRRDRCVEAGFDETLSALTTASRLHGARTAVVATLPETLPESRAEALAAAGIAPLCGFDDALAAVAAAVELGEVMARPAAVVPPQAVLPPGCRLLSEFEAKRALAEYGLAVPRGRLAASASAAVEAAEALGFPVVVKAVGGGLAHKTEKGAVRLGLRAAPEVRQAATALLGLGEALLVEEMITDGVAELIVGVERDAVFGPHLMVGSGGVLVELIGDRRLLMLPASREEIRAAILSLKAAGLIAGHRGRAAGDLEAAVEAVVAIQAYALRAAVLELDVNPLIVRPQGAIAVDALIRLAGEGGDA
ncbi:MAG TPA: acetate--CoA ligase family protein [Stellaceae bacterium]|nr:acetate--CoA ligase family protein [Stellaceae bacterium]